MKRASALVGLAALCGVTLFTAAASAMPVTIPGHASQASNVQQAAYVCNGWGHCWDRPDYRDRYYHPHYWGGWGWHRGWGYGWHHWHRHYDGGWGWHHWHRNYYGGWGWHHWHHWHHW